MQSKKTDQVSQGNENVFVDLGFSSEEAINLKIRADLMLNLRDHIQKQGWTQAEAAICLGETQPRISNLMNGEVDRFSIDKLINMLTKIGMQVKIEVSSPAS